MKKIAIPIETKAREFLGKLWLGLNLLECNHSVILGPSGEIKNTLHISKPDVYITKDPGDGNVEFFSKLRKAGCSVCGLDTEGAVYPKLEDYAKNKTKSLNYFDYYFLWGEAQAEFIKNKSKNPDSIVATGNPRFDLLNSSLRTVYTDESDRLRSTYRDYILFNMNYSWANHFNPEKHVEQQKKLFGEYDMKKYEHFSILWSEFLAAIHFLQSRLDVNIIVRPHPSEDPSTYERIFRNYENVFVEYSGDVRNWIAGTIVTIHNSCTTGIESAMMDQPTISYRPINNEKYDKELPNLVSDEVYDRDELLDRISHYINGNTQYKLTDKQSSQLKRYFHNLDFNGAGLIAKKIDTIDTSEKTDFRYFEPNTAERLKWRARSSMYSDKIIHIYDETNKLFGNLEPAEKREYRRQKFGNLTVSEIEHNIQKLVHHSSVKKVSVSKLSATNNTFIITATKN